MILFDKIIYVYSSFCIKECQLFRHKMSIIDKKLSCYDDLWTKRKTIHRKAAQKAPVKAVIDVTRYLCGFYVFQIIHSLVDNCG